MATTLTEQPATYIDQEVHPHREAPANPRRSRHGINVGEFERGLSAVGGALLVLRGLSQRSLGGLALAALGGGLMRRGLSGHCAGYQALGLDTSDAPHGALASVAARAGVKVEKSITINRTPAELYRIWRTFENLPRFMRHLAEVRGDTGGRSHWVAHGPLGFQVEWDAEIVNEKENELIAWRSLEGADVDTAGSVHFAQVPADWGTEIKVVLKYDPPAGKAGAMLARLFGAAPEQQIVEDLRRFKQWMETGETASTEGQPSGRW
ncbi:MAG: SRPBCC family protein [Planctomycetia bacterium]|nr:SRPBCC family protein [Planctomycetia bacterium]